MSYDLFQEEVQGSPTSPGLVFVDCRCRLERGEQKVPILVEMQVVQDLPLEDVRRNSL